MSDRLRIAYWLLFGKSIIHPPMVYNLIYFVAIFAFFNMIEYILFSIVHTIYLSVFSSELVFKAEFLLSMYIIQNGILQKSLFKIRREERLLL